MKKNMNFRKTWDKKEGLTVLFEGGDLKMMSLKMLKLSVGNESTNVFSGQEAALVILCGKCDVKGESFCFNGIGKRKNVFDGAATAVYVPVGEKFTVKAITETEIAVALAPAEKAYPAKLIRPEDVIIKDLGKDGWKRQAHFVLDERTDANLLYIGEAYVKSGMWASYPPHKHDEDNMPAEGILEEIYYYEFDKPQGFGIQRVYDKQGAFDETYTVKSGDAVEIPKGYHPFCCAPGYDNYYLWIMAGKNRGFFMTTEEKHKWLNEKQS